jgi:hypothetical protein
MPKARKLFGVLAEAVKAYFVPLSLLGTIIKLYEKLPLTVTIGLGAGLVLWIGGYVYIRVRQDRKQRAELEVYESLWRLSDPERFRIDEAFEYDCSSRTVAVVYPDAIVEAWDEGRNVSSEPQNEVVRTLVSDSPIDFSKLALRAWSEIGGGQRQPASITYAAMENGKRFMVRIRFNGGVVQPGVRLKVGWDYRWPGAVSRNEDYWVFPLKGYARPVKELKIRCCFREDPVYRELVHRSDHFTPVALDGPEVSRDADGSSYHCYSRTIAHPTGIYMLKWRLRAEP